MKNNSEDIIKKTAYVAMVNLVNSFDKKAAKYLVEKAEELFV